MSTATESDKVPDKQVPLDTIPLSPPGGERGGDKEYDGNSRPSDSGDASGEVTVFHNNEEFNVIHPLEHHWSLWFTKPPSGKGDNWYDLLKKVCDKIDSVEKFWGVHNNIEPTSKIHIKSDYHLFKLDVRPEWEDPQNKTGGRWSYSFYKKDYPNLAIDDLWLWTMLAAIGETLEPEHDRPSEVMGVVVNVRKGFYRISVWTRTTGKSSKGGENDVLREIGRKFKEVLQLGPSETVEFSSHAESAASGSTRAKSRFVV